LVEIQNAVIEGQSKDVERGIEEALVVGLAPWRSKSRV